MLLAPAPSAAGQSVGRALGGVDRCQEACSVEELSGGQIVEGQQPVWSILYGHVQNQLDLNPLNVQPPDPKHEPDRRLNAQLCTETRTNTPSDLHFKNCQLRLFSSPGLVEFEDAQWRIHQEPGIAYPIPLVDDTVRFYVTFSTQAASQLPQVSARLETGRFPGRGLVIAESRPADAVPRQVIAAGPGDPYDAWEVMVPLRVLRHQIPADDNGFLLTLQYSYHEDPLADVGAPGVQLRVGAAFPPRLVYRTVEPLSTIDHEIRRWAGETYFRWSFNAALGAYNVDERRLRISSSDQASLPDEWFEHLILKRSIDHDGRFKPLRSTWKLNHTAHPLPDGEYVVTASVRDLAHSYRLDHSFTFTASNGRPDVEGEIEFKGRAVPAPGVAVLAALGLAFLIGRAKGKDFQAAPSE
jgi:hypothetical protein